MPTLTITANNGATRRITLADASMIQSIREAAIRNGATVVVTWSID